MNTPETISPEALHARREQGEVAAIIDVREPDEYRSLHVAGALTLPLGEVSADAVADRLDAADYAADTPVFFICHTGRRSAEACARVVDAYPAATLVEGGTLAWAQAKLPTRSGEQA